MAKEKIENYSEAQATMIREAYVAAVESGADFEARKALVEKLAEQLGKSAKSVTAKLSRMGVYVAKVYVTKTGEKPVKKDDRADAIGKILRLSEPDTESLAKANAKALTAIFTALANSVPIEVETPEEMQSKAESLKAIQSVITLDETEAKSLSRVNAGALYKLAVFLTAPTE